MTSTDTRHAYAPLFDEREFTRRIVYDQQFVDLSERYDPIEATVDAHLEPCRLTATERLLIATSFASAAAMALAACLS